MNEPTRINWKRTIVEILTIFFSVTAAFALDRWSDARKEAELERKSVIALIRDMADDSASLAETIKHNSDNLDAVRHFLQLIRRDAVPADSSVWMAIRMLNINKFIPSTATFEMLKSSGGLSAIRDFDLRDQILTTYERYEGRALIESFEQHLVEAYVTPYLYSHLDFAGFKALDPSFYKKTEFQNLVVGLISQRQQKIQYYLMCQEECRKLKGKLESYQP